MIKINDWHQSFSQSVDCSVLFPFHFRRLLNVLEWLFDDDNRAKKKTKKWLNTIVLNIKQLPSAILLCIKWTKSEWKDDKKNGKRKKENGGFEINHGTMYSRGFSLLLYGQHPWWYTKCVYVWAHSYDNKYDEWWKMNKRKICKAERENDNVPIHASSENTCLM